MSEEKDIISLDSSEEKKEKEENCYYIKHTNHSNVYKLNENSWKISKLLDSIINHTDKNKNYGKKKDPILISNINIKENILLFITNYINFYSNKKEKLAPTAPLAKIHISEIFNDEYILFKPIIDEKKDIAENLIYINDFIEASLYFGINELDKKLSAIIAYMLSSIDNIDILNKSFKI